MKLPVGFATLQDWTAGVIAKVRLQPRRLADMDSNHAR